MSRPSVPLSLILAAIVALSGSAATAETTKAEATAPRFEPNPHPHSVVVDWVDAMLLAIELNPPAPTATTWRMWVVLSSIYDAWAAYDEKAVATASGSDLRRPASERKPANQELAVSYAAYNALTYAYPDQTSIFDEVMAHQGLEADASVDPTTPIGIGNLAAETCIRRRLVDGANAGTFTDVTSVAFLEPYSPVTDGGPNHWAPLHVPTGRLVDEHGTPTWSADEPDSYTVQSFLTPHWGAVMPFALRSGDELRPPAPPQLGYRGSLYRRAGQYLDERPGLPHPDRGDTGL